MVKLKRWQWIVLVLPIVAIGIFLLGAAGWQIHQWRLNWIWGVVTLLLLGWRWLLVRWTQPAIGNLEAVMAEVSQEIASGQLAPSGSVSAPPIAPAASSSDSDRSDSRSPDSSKLDPSKLDPSSQAEQALRTVLAAAQADRPIWEDWATFWQRCQEIVVAIAQIYHPEVKYPLLNIYIPQAYGLMRGTVNDLDTWMQKLSPVLGQVTIAQAVEAYEVYRRLEPSARRLLRVWNWAQWLLNPVAAVARQVSQRSGNQATQQLLGNLGQLLREAALRNLAQQAIALYGGTALPAAFAPVQPALPAAQTQSLRQILAQSEPTETVTQKPVSLLLVGRTGAGKSSLINTLFQAEQAAVDVLPSTDRLQSYQWQTDTGDRLLLWDTPGYEQADRQQFRDWVLDHAKTVDLVLLVTPALDPALQMDADFLQDLKAELESLPIIGVITQVDRLRPVREWQPPYDWQWGDRPKEKSIREALNYRLEMLKHCDRILPVVTGRLPDSPSSAENPLSAENPSSAENTSGDRIAWGTEALALTLLELVSPAKQLRLARFLRNQEARTVAAAALIDRYAFQMTTTQGIAALLKSPVLQFISTLATGSPALAQVLATQIPVEQLPIVIGRLQLAYELFKLLHAADRKFDLMALWPLLSDGADFRQDAAQTSHQTWALGQALVEYWTQPESIEQLQQRYRLFLHTPIDR